MQAAQDRWRAELEAQPVAFMLDRLAPALRQAAAELAAFLGAEAGDLALVANATEGANAVLRAVDLGPGDVVLATSGAYPAVRNTLSHLCRERGATLHVVALPTPLAGPEAAVEPVVAALDRGARLAVLDHVVSASGTVLPIAALCRACRERGVAVLVDGAHAPGMLDLDVPAIGADWYVGNCHKWLCAPKGAGFLWARKDRRERLHPAVISNLYGAGFPTEFEWTGTRDYSAVLAVPAALAFWRELGPAAARDHMASLAAEAAATLSAAWDSEAAAPPAMCAAMAAVRAPVAGAADYAAARALRDRLLAEHRIEVAVNPIDDSLWVRVSAHVYNSPDQYLRLAEALR